MTMPAGAARRPTRGSRIAAPALAVAVAVALGAAVVLRHGADPLAIAGAGYVAATTWPLCAADWRERRLPNSLVLPGYLFGAIGVLWAALSSGRPPWTAVLCAVATLGVALVVAATGGLGPGDAKLAGLLALVLGGLCGGPAVVTAVGAACVTAGAAAVSGILGGRDGSTTGIAFGPHLLGGFWVTLLLW